MALQARAYPGFCSMKRLGVFFPPRDGMLIHHRVTPSVKFARTHLYIYIKCLTREHKTMFPSRARTQTARSGDKHTNLATAPSAQAYKSQVKTSPSTKRWALVNFFLTFITRPRSSFLLENYVMNNIKSGLKSGEGSFITNSIYGL